jgi:aerotaxis receptor
VTPLMQGGQPVGYMSVRTEATREQIDAAERLYATMREEKERGQLIHTLKQGRLIRRTLAGRAMEAMRLGLSGKLFLVLLGVLLVSQLLRWVLPDGGLGVGVDVALELGLLGLAWWYISRMVVAPLGGLVASANSMAAGDLTQAVAHTRSDQMGELEAALSQLGVNLRSIVRDARDQSAEMVHGTSEIAQGNLDLSQRTETQASNLQETAASMEQITGTVRQSAESARQASRLSAQASEVAERGSQAVEDVSVTMRAIQESSHRIGEITQVIDSIAFQTNILALNAAVEAARAGEQGRGFAVVAAEVRSLAQRTSTAAKEIRQLIEESAAKVGAGHEKTEAARKTMADAVSGVRRVNTLVDEISHGATEQLTGISQINAAVAQMDSITQQNAALVEQIAASAQSLERLSQATTETVAVFRLDRGAAPQRDAVALRREMKAAPAVPRGPERHNPPLAVPAAVRGRATPRLAG